jgi:transcription elongation factor GreB
MSKAFTKESDLEKEEPLRSLRPTVPPGVTNYITASGAKNFQDELTTLTRQKAELQAAQHPPQESELRPVESRIKQIKEILGSTIVAKPSTKGREKVRFGATATVRRARGDQKIYQIVGVDEANPDEGRISWLSPLAQQLLLKQAGDQVTFSSPDGEEMIEVIQVSYDDCPTPI